MYGDLEAVGHAADLEVRTVGRSDHLVDRKQRSAEVLPAPR
jgi:hypothetical protein